MIGGVENFELRKREKEREGGKEVGGGCRRPWRPPKDGIKKENCN